MVATQAKLIDLHHWELQLTKESQQAEMNERYLHVRDHIESRKLGKISKKKGRQTKMVLTKRSSFLLNIDGKGDGSLTSAELAVALRNLTIPESIVTLFREKLQAIQKKWKTDHQATPLKMNYKMKLALI